MKIELNTIGYAKTDSETVPRHWTVSDVGGEVIIFEDYTEGMKDIKIGQDIVVIFYFHKSPAFDPKHLIQKPPHHGEYLGIFSTCSPIRPNAVGMSVLRVTDIEKNIIYVKGLDMVDGTPILDIKPLTGLKRDKAL